MVIFFKIIIFINLLFFSSLVFASELNVLSSTPAQYTNKATFQKIKIDFECTGDWKIILTPLNQNFVNVLNPNKIIPVNRLIVSYDSGIEQTNIQPEKSFVISQGNDFGHKNLDLALKIINFDSDYPGDYWGDMKFTLVTNNEELDRIYTLRFNQPVIQDLESNEERLSINIQEDEAFKKGITHYLDNPTTLYVKSNKEWKLYLVAPTSNNDLKYFFKVISKPQDTQSNYDKEYFEVKNEEKVVLTGKATVDEQTGQLKPRAVKINYMIKTPQNDVLDSGQIQQQIEYILDE